MHKFCCLSLAAFLTWGGFASADERVCAGGGGDASSALRVAYERFDQDLSEAMRGEAEEGLKGFLAHIENYQIRINIEGDHYIISFTPSKYQGGTVKGGGAEYIIKKCSHNVERMRPYM